ncbi:hypothetical protein SIN8267_02136 [Sinobacterium norvegicum]|uniref:Uncharacterized protein n=1 Tax=Sinobacterium norvegicum TaxID=1641715 RepID=A0ABM9AFP7_9GAMM|nr:hypothetical protein [Sinobacterium norvegicum]CAH0992021.1 hypothetical protein SIN8267_02136 [Sinobacterium norvegicum]
MILKKLTRRILLKAISFVISRPKLRHIIQNRLPIPGRLNAWLISKWAANNAIIGGDVRKTDDWGHKPYHSSYYELKIAEEVSAAYGLNIDHSYVNELRAQQFANYDNESTKSIIHTISCIYLALLTRYPLQADIIKHTKNVKKEKKFNSVFTSIFNSQEFKKKGYRRVE